MSADGGYTFFKVKRKSAGRHVSTENVDDAAPALYVTVWL
jgi:hypothetical protein